MRKEYKTTIKIPEGIECGCNEDMIECKKGDKKFQRKIEIMGAEVSVADGKIIISSKKANKKTIKFIMSLVAHVKNGIKGLEEDFVYKLEVCNVHFPMTVKLQENKLLIGNFLGEKEPRIAEISEGVIVDVKGKDITVSSQNLEKAGQTAANIERATKVSKKDRRIFQDGIFITEKPKGAI